MNKPLHPEIRYMIRRDLPEVVAIENEAFDMCWSKEDFIYCIRQRNTIGLVAELPTGRIGGFVLYAMHKTKLHLLNFAVHAGFRHRGIGTTMIEELKNKLSLERRTRLSLEVRETNLSAQLFFRAMGFRAVNLLRNIYDDAPQEDAIVMHYRHPAPVDIELVSET